MLVGDMSPAKLACCHGPCYRWSLGLPAARFSTLPATRQVSLWLPSLSFLETRCARFPRYAGPTMPLVGPDAKSLYFLLIKACAAVGQMPGEPPHRSLSSLPPRRRLKEMAQALRAITAPEHDAMSMPVNAVESGEPSAPNLSGFNPEDFKEEQTIRVVDAQLRVAFPFASMSKRETGVVDGKMMFKFQVAGRIGQSGGGHHACAFFAAGSLSSDQIGEVLAAVHSGVLDYMVEHEYAWTKKVRYTCV